MSFSREIKNRVIKLCKNKYFRSLLFPLIRLIGKKTYVERILKIQAEEKYFSDNHNNRIVLRGPFKGMKYATFDSYGSELAPKIIGSYEMELNDVIESVIRDESITEIIDVGSAEGYYAIGFAIKKKNALVYAYDIKEEALNLCRAMAEENNVNGNIIYGDFCSDKTLAAFKSKNRAFIISDCEGYELQLFNESNIGNLERFDLLIELHDFINPVISNTLKRLFNKTHDIKIIRSEKRDSDNYIELQKYSEQEKKLILSECRIGILDEQPMEWLYAKAKVSS